MPRYSFSTEADLSSFIIDDVLKGVANDLAWTTQANVQPIINAVLSYLKVDDLMDLSDEYHIELVARYKTWFAVVEETTLDYTSSEADASLSRSDMHKQALLTLALAEKALQHYEGTLPTNVVATTLRSRSNTIRPTW